MSHLHRCTRCNQPRPRGVLDVRGWCEPCRSHTCRKHPAGTSTCYTSDACRCARCCDAHGRDHKAWRGKRLRGERLTVSAVGSVRRLQSLCFTGFSRAELGEMLGVHKGTVDRFLDDNPAECWESTAQRIIDVYEAHWRGPQGGDKWSRSRARNAAKRRGWVAPMAWDDDDGPHGIDNPAATPDLADGPRRRAGETSREVERMLGTDSAQGIARRLGYADADSLATSLSRKHKHLADKLRAEKEVA